MNLEEALSLNDEPDSEKAARVLHQMALQHNKQTMPDGWRDAVREALGVQRLRKSRLQEVLDAGKALNLFALVSGENGPYLRVHGAEEPPAPSPPVEDEDARAARAVYEGLKKAPHKTDLDAWKDTIKSALGIKRLRKSRLKKVMAAGEAAGLFQWEKGRLRLLQDADNRVQEDADNRVQEDAESPPPRAVPSGPQPSTVPPEPPADWNPPGILNCGHMDGYTEEAHREARAEGYCCSGGKRNMPVHWHAVKDRPIPKNHRRTKEKVATGGFPGYCCDEKGYYIGGVVNNCLHQHRKDPSHPLCGYHTDLARARNRV